MTPTALTAPTAPVRLRKERAIDLHRIDDRHRFRMLQIAHGGRVLMTVHARALRHAGSGLQASHSRPLARAPVRSLLHRRAVLKPLVALDCSRAERAQAISCVPRPRIRGQWEWFRATATRFGYTPTEGHDPDRVTALFVAPLHRAQSNQYQPTHTT